MRPRSEVEKAEDSYGGVGVGVGVGVGDDEVGWVSPLDGEVCHPRA